MSLRMFPLKFGFLKIINKKVPQSVFKLCFHMILLLGGNTHII